MKATGIKKKVDKSGRLPLPEEILKRMNIGYQDAVEVYVDRNYILLKKEETSCIFCEGIENLVEYRGKIVCRECLNEIKFAG